MQVIQGSRNHCRLTAALQATGLAEALSGPGPFIVFAPSDRAFSALNDAQFNALLCDQNALRGLLTYHVAPGNLLSCDLRKLNTLGTLAGPPVALGTRNGSPRIWVNDTKVSKPDIVACNGVVYSIDCLLQPGCPPVAACPPMCPPVAVCPTPCPPIAACPSPCPTPCPTCPPIVTSRSLTGVPPVRVMPTSPQIARVPQYQMGVAMAPQFPIGATMVPGTMMQTAMQPGDVIQVAGAVEDYSTFMQAVQVAGLTEFIQNTGPITVFQPNNAAFSTLPSGTLESLMGDPVALRQVLLQHITPGQYNQAMMTGGIQMNSFMGQPLLAACVGPEIVVNCTRIVGSALIACNGSIETLDGVLVPQINPCPCPVPQVVCPIPACPIPACPTQVCPPPRAVRPVPTCPTVCPPRSSCPTGACPTVAPRAVMPTPLPAAPPQLTMPVPEPPRSMQQPGAVYGPLQ